MKFFDILESLIDIKSTKQEYNWWYILVVILYILLNIRDQARNSISTTNVS